MSRKKTRSKLAPIYDIDDMIGLFGLKPFDDIDIVFMGMRPGEKLFEELETGGENITKTKHPKIFIGTINTPRYPEGRRVGHATLTASFSTYCRARSFSPDSVTRSTFVPRRSRKYP